MYENFIYPKKKEIPTTLISDNFFISLPYMQSRLTGNSDTLISETINANT